MGVQIPILVGISEYAILLALKKYYNGKDKSTLVTVSQDDKDVQEPTPVVNFSKDIQSMVATTTKMELHWDFIERTVDKWTFMGSLVFILSFNIIYWFLTLM